MPSLIPLDDNSQRSLTGGVQKPTKRLIPIQDSTATYATSTTAPAAPAPAKRIGKQRTVSWLGETNLPVVGTFKHPGGLSSDVVSYPAPTKDNPGNRVLLATPAPLAGGKPRTDGVAWNPYVVEDDGNGGYRRVGSYRPAMPVGGQPEQRPDGVYGAAAAPPKAPGIAELMRNRQTVEQWKSRRPKEAAELERDYTTYAELKDRNPMLALQFKKSAEEKYAKLQAELGSPDQFISQRRQIDMGMLNPPVVARSGADGRTESMQDTRGSNMQGAMASQLGAGVGESAAAYDDAAARVAAQRGYVSDNAVGRTLQSFGTGVESVAAGAARLLPEELVGNATLDEVSRNQTAFQQAASERAGGVGRAVQGIAQSYGVVAPGAALGAVTGGAATGMALSAGLSQYGQSYQQATDAGLRGADRERYATVNAAAESLMSVAFTKLLKMPGLEGAFVKSGLGAENVKGVLLKAAKQVGMSGLEELPEEVLTQIAQNVNARFGVDPSRKILTGDELFDIAVQSMGAAGAARAVGIAPQLPGAISKANVIRGNAKAFVESPTGAADWAKSHPLAAEEIAAAVQQGKPISRAMMEDNALPVMDSVKRSKWAADVHAAVRNKASEVLGLDGTEQPAATESQNPIPTEVQRSEEIRGRVDAERASQAAAVRNLGPEYEQRAQAIESGSEDAAIEQDVRRQIAEEEAATFRTSQKPSGPVFVNNAQPIETAAEGSFGAPQVGDEVVDTRESDGKAGKGNRRGRVVAVDGDWATVQPKFGKQYKVPVGRLAVRGRPGTPKARGLQEQPVGEGEDFVTPMGGSSLSQNQQTAQQPSQDAAQPNIPQQPTGQPASPAQPQAEVPPAQQAEVGEPAPAPPRSLKQPAALSRGQQLQVAQRAYPGAVIKPVVGAEGRYEVTLPNGKFLTVLFTDDTTGGVVNRQRIRESLEARNPGRKVSEEDIDRATVRGFWRVSDGKGFEVDGQGLVRILDSLNEGQATATALHEARHSLVSMGLMTQAEFDALAVEAARQLNADPKTIADAEEAIAVLGEKGGLGARGFLQTLRDIINRFMAAITGDKWKPNAQTVTKRIQSGKMLRRAGKTETRREAAQRLSAEISDARYSAELAGANPDSTTDKAAAAKAWREQGTDSPWFKRWFGKSKVVDAEGKPLVVYHGTPFGKFSDIPQKQNAKRDEILAQITPLKQQREAISNQIDEIAKAAGEKFKKAKAEFDAKYKDRNFERSIAGQEADELYRTEIRAENPLREQYKKLTDQIRKLSDQLPSKAVNQGEVFNTNARGSTDQGWLAAGTSFTDRKSVADSYSRMSLRQGERSPYVYEVYLRIENPWSDQASKDNPDIAKEIYEESERRSNGLRDLDQKQRARAEAKRYVLEKHGFDGEVAVDKFDAGTEYVAFHPTQIKSATANTGEFDEGNADIRYSASIEPVDISKFGWREKDDEYLYHVTSKPAADKITKSGFGRGKSMFTAGSYPAYSKGKTFFTDRSGVKYWEDRVEQQLFHNYDDPPEVSAVRIPKSMVADIVQDDKTGTDDAKHNAYYVDTQKLVKAQSQDSNSDIRYSAAEPTQAEYPKSHEVTRTDEFKKWFGDSKVVDESGEPMRVYHATPHAFKTFKPGGKGKKMQSGRAIWMTPNAEYQQAAHNTGVRWTNKGYNAVNDDVSVMPLYARIERPLVVNDMTREWSTSVYGKDFPFLISDDVAKKLKDDGYDGVLYYSQADIGKSTGKVFTPSVLTEVVALDANQVKSAIANKGKFSRSNDSVLYSAEQDATQAQKERAARLANPGTSQQTRDDIDRQRLSYPDPDTRSMMEVFAQADAISPQQVRALADAGRPTTDAETEAILREVDRTRYEALVSKDAAKMRDAEDLLRKSDAIGTEQGRALHARRDKVETPFQRNQRLLGDALLGAPLELREAIKQAEKAAYEAEKSGDKKKAVEERKRADNLSRRGRLIAERNRAFLERIGMLPKDKAGWDELAGNSVRTERVIREAMALNQPWMSSIGEYWNSTLLSGPATQIRNLLGTPLNYSFILAERALGTAIKTLTFRQSPAKTAKAFAAFWNGMMKSGAIDHAMRSYVQEVPTFDRMFNRDNYGGLLEDMHGKYSITGVKGRIIRGIGWGPLRAADQFWKALIGSAEVGRHAYAQASAELGPSASSDAISARMSELMVDRSSAAWKKALEVADVATFTEGGSKGRQEFKTAIKNLRNKVPGGKFIVPFVDTPINIAAQTIQRAPVLGALRFLPQMIANRKSGRPIFSGISEVAVRQLIGWAAYFAINGAVSDDDDRDFAITSGQHPDQAKRYALKIGNKYLSYQGLEPIASLLALMADYKSSNSPTAVASSVIEQIANKPMLQGLGDILRIIQPSDMAKAETKTKMIEANLANWAKNFGASWVPALYRQTVNALRPESINTRIMPEDADNPNKPKMFGKRVIEQAGLDWAFEAAGLKTPAAKRIDVWGEPQSPVIIDSSPTTDFFYRLLSPLRTAEENTHPGNELLAAWNRVKPEGAEDYSLPEVTPYYTDSKGKKQMFTESQYEKFQRLAGGVASNLYARGKFDPANPTEGQVSMLTERLLPAAKDEARKLVVDSIVTGKPISETPEQIAERLDKKVRASVFDAASEKVKRSLNKGEKDWQRDARVEKSLKRREIAKEQRDRFYKKD